MLTSKSMAQGCILWLTDPFKDQVKDQGSDDSDSEQLDLPETYNGVETGLLGHPVMVLHTLEGTTDVAVCLLTTLRGRDLKARKDTYGHQYDHEFFLAIHPREPPCPFLYPQLRLVNDIWLRKPGYLSIKKRYTVPLSMLEPYDRKRSESHYQLTPESFAIVASTFAMKIAMPAEVPAIKSAGPVHCELPDNAPARLESKALIPHSEPQLGSEKNLPAKSEPPAKPQSELESDSKITPDPPVPAKLSSASTEPLGKTSTTGIRSLLASGGLKSLFSAALTVDAKMAVRRLREIIDAFKARFHKSKA